jgi:hypothetical protein
MKDECDDTLLAHKEKLTKMIAVREEKLKANKKVTSDVEVSVVTTIRAARTKLAYSNAIVPIPIINLG